jgi:predicted nucleic acid-binding protein
MNAVDTNVLIYVRDPRDPQKQAAAIDLLANLKDRLLLWQVACEYLAASRKLEHLGYSSKDAFAHIREISGLWTVVRPSPNVFDIAENLLARFSLSFWDAILVAACIEARAKRLYTEDFSGYPNIDGVEIINPFQTA